MPKSKRRNSLWGPILSVLVLGIFISGLLFTYWGAALSPLHNYFKQREIRGCCINATATVISTDNYGSTPSDPRPSPSANIMLKATLPWYGVVYSLDYRGSHPRVRLGQKVPVLIDKRGGTFYFSGQEYYSLSSDTYRLWYPILAFVVGFLATCVLTWLSLNLFFPPWSPSHEPASAQ